MWIELPSEVLEHIFTDSDISKKDLIQLQLTCKPWSSIAQKHLYREIDIVDQTLYGDSAQDYDKMVERIRLLAQTLLFLNTHARNWVKTIDADALLHPDVNTDSSQDPTLNLTMVAHLCPNITKILGRNLSSTFYDAISNLYRSGSLQSLESLSSPTWLYVEDEKALISSYSKAAIALKDTLKDLTVTKGAGGNTDATQPASLAQFPRIEHLQLEEFSRLHLSRLGVYISSCCLKTTAISILFGNRTTEMNEHNDQSDISPPTQVQELAIYVHGVPLVTTELAFIMRMFPSLQCLTFEIDQYVEKDIVPIQDSMEVVVQFFKYLSLILRVDLKHMWFGVSEGFDLLPHLASLMNVQELTITSLNTEVPDAVAISLEREIQLEEGTSNASSDKKDTIKTKCSVLGIDIDTNDTEAALHSTLEMFKGKSVDHLIIGPSDDYATTFYQNITEESMDCIMDEYQSLQELTYQNTAFPSKAPLLKSRGTKCLKRLLLSKCKITEDYFTRLSCQLAYVDQFALSTTMEEERKHNPSINGIRICLPYTTINTFVLSILDLPSYSIKVWTNHSCNEFDVLDQVILKTDRAIVPFKIIIHCQSVQSISTLSNLIQLQ